LDGLLGVLFPITLFFEINVTIIQYLMLALILQNLCVTATHQPIKEILEKKKKVSETIRVYARVTLISLQI